MLNRIRMKIYCGAANPRADDILSGSKDINDSAIVGEGSPGISDGACTDGVGRWCTSGAGVGGISVGVTGGDLFKNINQTRLPSIGNVTYSDMNSGGGELARNTSE